MLCRATRVFGNVQDGVGSQNLGLGTSMLSRPQHHPARFQGFGTLEQQLQAESTSCSPELVVEGGALHSSWSLQAAQQPLLQPGHVASLCSSLWFCTASSFSMPVLELVMGEIGQSEGTCSCRQGQPHSTNMGGASPASGHLCTMPHAGEPQADGDLGDMNKQVSPLCRL